MESVHYLTPAIIISVSRLWLTLLSLFVAMRQSAPVPLLLHPAGRTPRHSDVSWFPGAAQECGHETVHASVATQVLPGGEAAAILGRREPEQQQR